METNKNITGVVINGQEYVFEGVPPEVFLNSPSPFMDEKVKAYIVDRVEEPEEGGYNVFYVNQKYARKGVIFPEALVAINNCKRPLRSQVQIFRNLWFVYAPWMCIPYFKRKIMWNYAGKIASDWDYILNRFYLKQNKYCTVVREIFRAAQKTFETMQFNNDQRWVMDRLVIGVGMFLEYDDSYRYKCQDGLGEINKEAFEKDPVQEIIRIFNLMVERDVDYFGGGKPGGAIGGRFNVFMKVLRVLFFLHPSWKRIAKDFVRELDVEKVKLDESDFYHCMIRPDYMHRGMKYEDKVQMRQTIDQVYWPKKQEELVPINEAK